MNKKADFVNSYFGSIYLTIIALLQGVAIYQLIPYLITYFTSSNISFSDLYTVPLFLTLFIIFIVWHHYVNGILFLRWFPNIIDALIPFAISISEFFLISFLECKNQPALMNIHAWVQSFIFFLLMGSIAYFAAAYRHEPELFINFMDKENSIVHGKLIHRFYNIQGLSMLLQGIIAIFILLIHWYGLLWFSLFLFILHILISEYLHIRRILPAFKKGLSEFYAENN